MDCVFNVNVPFIYKPVASHVCHKPDSLIKILAGIVFFSLSPRLVNFRAGMVIFPTSIPNRRGCQKMLLELPFPKPL